MALGGPGWIGSSGEQGGAVCRPGSDGSRAVRAGPWGTGSFGLVADAAWRSDGRLFDEAYFGALGCGWDLAVGLAGGLASGAVQIGLEFAHISVPLRLQNSQIAERVGKQRDELASGDASLVGLDFGDFSVVADEFFEVSFHQEVGQSPGLPVDLGFFLLVPGDIEQTIADQQADVCTAGVRGDAVVAFESIFV